MTKLASCPSARPEYHCAALTSRHAAEMLALLVLIQPFNYTAVRKKKEEEETKERKKNKVAARGNSRQRVQSVSNSFLRAACASLGVSSRGCAREICERDGRRGYHCPVGTALIGDAGEKSCADFEWEKGRLDGCQRRDAVIFLRERKKKGERLRRNVHWAVLTERCLEGLRRSGWDE